MKSSTLINANPTVYEVKTHEESNSRFSYAINNGDREWIDSEELFEWIRHIHDPEHPYTLEQLHVIFMDSIHVRDKENSVVVEFTPTIPHCTMATLIGLCIRVRLMRCLPKRFKITVKVTEGSHQTEDQLNRQLNDKERVAAALENQQLLGVVNQCLASCT
jgi:metal-sulfur cluster biosynthetic enzyme